MRDYPLQLSIESDGKNIYIHPVVESIHGSGCIEGTYMKLKYSCSSSELGECIKNSFLYIKKKYENGEEPDQSKEYKSISWKKRAAFLASQNSNGHIKMIPEYTDHLIMTNSSIEHLYCLAERSVDALGNAAFDCLQKSFDYAKRKEIAVYYSDEDGLLFVPMAVNRTGYVLADFCVCVKKPYSPEEVCDALNIVQKFLEMNSEDNRTNKERKNNLPWREYSKYKSMHGFVKKHHCIQIHILVNGNIEFIPNLRIDSYDSCFVPYEHLKSVIVYNRYSEEITQELWKTFEVCDLMYKKSREPDTSCHNDIFFEYVNELRKQRNDLYLTWEEWEQKCK